MTTNNFDPEISNANLNSPQYYIDDDGSLKFISPYLASSNFDGIISVVEGPITAQNIKAGMLLQVISGQYYPVVSVAYDDPDLETSANIITVGYLDSLNELNTIDYNFTDSVNVRYEDWDNKVMGSQGWTITSGGNAIFTNVAVRGRIEAEEGWISGNLTIGENGIDTLNDLPTQTDLDGYIPDGGAAADVNSNFTNINGGKIRTGSIESTLYSYTSGNFSNNGVRINLDNYGYIRGPKFYIDGQTGNAYFSGDITGANGTFSGTLGSGISITSPTITGGTISTSTGINKVQLGPEDKVKFYWNSVLKGQIYMDTVLGDGMMVLEAPFFSFRSPGTSTMYAGDIYASSFHGDGTYITNLNATELKSGTIPATRLTGVSPNFGGVDSSGVYKVNGTTFMSSTRALTVDGITNQSGGITNNGGQITSLPTYQNSSTSIAANMHVNDVGVFRRAGSTQKIKTKIVPLNNIKLSSSVFPEKILNSSPTIDYKNILNITPVEFSPIEEVEKNKRILGFIAEDIAEKIPELATYDSNGDPEYFNINSIVSALLAVVQDQQKFIDDLQNRMLQLESQLGG